MQPLERDGYWVVDLDDPATLNRAIEREFDALAADLPRRTHFFHGRYENVYVEIAQVPSLATVLDAARTATAHILGRDPARLHAGFWFNLMLPGHVTTRHHHDENDELMSAVYYVAAPPNSGDLVLFGEGEQRIAPRDGRLVLFRPDVLHEVTRHAGEGRRMSVGINVGPC